MKSQSKAVACSIIALLFLLISAAPILAQSQSEAPSAAIEMDSRDPLREIISPRLIPIIMMDISPSLGDATLISRLKFVLSTGMVDAAAPYHPTAVGIYSRFDRQPETARTQSNINIAMLYAAYHVLVEMMPQRESVWREMLYDYGLDPEADSSDLNTPVGIGRAAGRAAIAGRLHDGMNQVGNYADTTAYRPVNTAYELLDPSRWQPGVRRQGSGLYTVQQFVTPQLANTEPFAPFDPRGFRVLQPQSSNVENWEAYKEQADAVLDVSANLTDEQKMKAELFDNKIVSLGYSYNHIGLDNKLSPQDFVRGFFLKVAAAHDALVVIWQEKARHDAVRPFSAIQHVYGDELVRAWAGPGRGTQDIPASQWQSYLPEADHPEYPSASACGCLAQAQAMRRFTGTDQLNWSIAYPAGSSRIEPGVTPARDIELRFPTWTEFARDCGQSRVWAGVHFQAAVDASVAMCSEFGDMAYEYFSTLMDGSAAQRPPSQALSPDPWRADIGSSASVNPAPPASSPMPESCLALPDSITVIAVSTGFQCRQLDSSRLSGISNFMTGVDLAGDLGIGAQVCFRGSGAIVRLDTSSATPSLSLLTSYTMSGMTCAWTDRAGLVMLAPQPSTQSASTDVPKPLANCAVTTQAPLNFRTRPVDGDARAIIPAATTLPARARSGNWFKVEYRDYLGWISARYVDSEGTCG